MDRNTGEFRSRRFWQVQNVVWKVLLLLGYSGFIFWLSSRSHIHIPHYFAWQDKLLHFILYIPYGWLLFRLIQPFTNKSKTQLYALIFLILYSISDEIHQFFVPGRNPDFYDVMADVLGGYTAIFLNHIYFTK